MRLLQPLWLAMALLTTLPVGRLVRAPLSARDRGRSVACYPLVGLMLGGLLAAAVTVLAEAPAPLAAAVTLTLWVGLTGALHLDGLADCVDAWFAGHGDSDRSLRVMQDPAAGPMAVAAIVLVLLLKFAALLALWPLATGALVTALVLGRCAAVALMLATPYRRREGIASAESARLPTMAVAASMTLAAAATALVVAPALWLAGALAAMLVGLWWRRLWRRRIGGYTGDVAGGLIELVETVVVVAAGLVSAWA